MQVLLLHSDLFPLTSLRYLESNISPLILFVICKCTKAKFCTEREIHHWKLMHTLFAIRFVFGLSLCLCTDSYSLFSLKGTDCRLFFFLYREDEKNLEKPL